MTLNTFFAQLRLLAKEEPFFILAGNKIRRSGAIIECPLTAVNNHEKKECLDIGQFVLAAQNLKLTRYKIKIQRAADGYTYCDDAMRRKLLEACGLVS